MLGKENAQLVLNRVYHAFPEHERLGMNITPRDNRRINNLVYWAQSGGDLKKNIEDSGKETLNFLLREVIF